MTRLENDVFLESLKQLFQKKRENGNVTVTMKRYDGKNKHVSTKVKKTKKPTTNPSEYMCLVRASMNASGKEKISTVVHAKDLIKFQIAYCQLLKSNIDGLKKNKKIKKTKA